MGQFNTYNPTYCDENKEGNLDHRNTASQDFVGVMSGWVFGIAVLLHIGKGVPVAQRPKRWLQADTSGLD